jgi:5-deoxy-glucuronate isomerase
MSLQLPREEYLMSAPVLAATEKNIFRKTNAHAGRRVCISPGNSSMRHLAYSRIVLNASKAAESFSTGDRETGLICLSGEAIVSVDGKEIALGQRDAMYIPRDSSVKISTKTSADVAEFSCDVANRYPLQVVRASEIAKDPGLQFTTGNPGCTRHLQMLLAKNIQAGRLIAGITQADPGNWTSWPPHEHEEMLEELYVYTEMPAPGFGVQFVYTNTTEPELITVVREGDAVLMPAGYHPNVAAPGHCIGFLWAMAAHREVEDRQFGVVNVQPGFGQTGSGLEASRK